MSERDSLPLPASCQLRAHAGRDGRVRLVTRNLSFVGSRQLGLDPEGEHPAALDLLVGALATDLLAGFAREAARAGVLVHDAELRLEGHLDNPLVALGVIGEYGSPALTRVQGKLFLSADADEPTLRSLWERACATAPVLATLQRSAAIDITLRNIL